VGARLAGRIASIRPLAWLAYFYLPLLLIAGGGGSPAPLSELFCELLAAFCLVAWVWLNGPAAIAAHRSLALAVGLIAAVPAVQLIPLPAYLWHELPGRALLTDTLTLVEAENGWWPLSVAPQRTLEALLSLLPPLLAMLTVACLSLQERDSLLRIITGFGILSVIVGAAQIASGASRLQFYAGAQPGILYGFQANRNAQVDVLLIVMLAAVAACQRSAQNSRAAAGMVGLLIAILLISAGLTGSRMGIALAPFVLLWCLSLRPWYHPAQGPVFNWPVLAIVGLASAGIAFAILQSRPFERVWTRFNFVGEYRPDIWRDTVFAIGEYWPTGSGIGTFTRMIGAAERLEAIGPTLPNRAHNEYLELLLEAGLPGAIAWLLVIVLAVTATWRSLQGRTTVPQAQAVFTAGTLTIAFLHSLVDYPLRSMALAGLVGVAAAFVLAPPRSGTLDL